MNGINWNCFDLMEYPSNNVWNGYFKTKWVRNQGTRNWLGVFLHSDARKKTRWQQCSNNGWPIQIRSMALVANKYYSKHYFPPVLFALQWRVAHAFVDLLSRLEPAKKKIVPRLVLFPSWRREGKDFQSWLLSNAYLDKLLHAWKDPF